MRFRVFRNGKIVDKFAVYGAYMFGNDGTSLRRARITFDRGFVECQKPSGETAGLALLWPIEGFGKILLPTTCLPDRGTPYCLNVEVARARLMQIISRREDWSLFDNSHDLDEVSRQAQMLFIKAIQNINDLGVASKLADESLRRAMLFSEKLALIQAEKLFKNRKKAGGLARGCVGCRIDLDRMTDAAYIDSFTELMPFAVVPVPWAQIEAREGVFDFSKVDQCIEILRKRRLVIGAGPLLSFTEDDLPTWLQDETDDFERVQEVAYRFIQSVVSRYANKVHRWFVIRGLNAHNHLGFSIEQTLEITRAANMAVKAVNSRAIKVIEVSNLWGEYYATTPNTVSPVAYMDMVVQSGISFDAFGFQMRFGKGQTGMFVRDMMQISSMLDYFAMMGKSLFLTGVEIPSKHGKGLFDPRVAGLWHREWDTGRQALWIEQFLAIALGRSCIESVVFGNFADREDGAIANSGLVTKSLKPKDAYKLLMRFCASVGSDKR